MLIEFIRIENWRSFYGINDFFVSKDPIKNVTLIRAENGVGKTSLLAAINWCFFGILPPESEFEGPMRLVNAFAAEKDGAHRTVVEIDFVHEDRTYRASRSYDQRTQTTNPLRLCELVEGGEVPAFKDRPDRFINSVIPKEMAPHFFFYGEATSRYTGSTGAKKFGEAVKGILGSTVARMALEDLRKAWQDYNKQASDNTSDEAREAEAAIEEAARRIAKAREDLVKLDEEFEAATSRIDKLNQELAETKPAKEAQARRARIEAQVATKEAERAKALQRSQGWMQTFATSVLAKELVAEASAVIANEDTRGKLPAPYDQKFVDDILSDGRCVCGREIEKGSIEYDRIKSLLDTAGDQAVMSRVMSTSTALGRLEQRAERAWSEYERNQDDLRKVEGEIQRLDADLLEISKELAANPVTDIAEKEEARERAKTQRNQAMSRKVDVQTAINGFERSRSEYEGRRDELVRKSEAARRYVKRAQLAAALTARLEGRLKDEEEAARQAIEREIDVIVKRFMRKPAKVQLDRNYQLRLFDERGDEMAKSTGENQLLGLAFTGAIAKYAKEREKATDDILLPGTVAPLVVDSPFGHLDPLYRRGVAEFLPNLATQVILLVSTSQASDAVVTTLADKIGQEYVLTRHSQHDGAGKQPETVEIRGVIYDLTTYGSEIEGTRITEVR
ncbi:MAG: AAA family ATPase [Acetobacteraceae bacterium]